MESIEYLEKLLGILSQSENIRNHFQGDIRFLEERRRSIKFISVCQKQAGQTVNINSLKDR